MAVLPESGLADGRETLRRFLAGEDTLASMLAGITVLATDTIPGADAASITMLSEGTPKTPASTEPRVLELDRRQYELGDGPCLSALRHHGVEHMWTATDERWPEFARAAFDMDIAAVMSAPLVEGEVSKGALNLYSTAGFGEQASEIACLFADQLGIAAVNTTLYVEATVMADQLRQAMESRAIIEQAKGILMGAQRCGPEPAFDILRRASQSRNRKLREIATEIVQRYTKGSDAAQVPDHG